jgi:hypothetical protein
MRVHRSCQCVLVGLLPALLSACSATPKANEDVAMSASSEPPMVCTLSPEQLSAQRAGLLPGLLKRADERTPLERGYRMTFAPPHAAGLLDDIARIVEQERGCCQFLKFQITVEPSSGPIYLEVTGPAGTREMLDAL